MKTGFNPLTADSTFTQSVRGNNPWSGFREYQFTRIPEFVILTLMSRNCFISVASLSCKTVSLTLDNDDFPFPGLPQTLSV